MKESAFSKRTEPPYENNNIYNTYANKIFTPSKKMGNTSNLYSYIISEPKILKTKKEN